MTLHAGTAKVVITPPVGVELAGYSFGPSLGILQDLEAQVLLLEDDLEKIVLITADLLAFGPHLVRAVRKRVAVGFGICADHILLSASHTHCGPATLPFRQWGAVDETYLCYLEDTLVGAVGAARRGLREVRFGYGLGHAEGISHNRRGHTELVDTQVGVLRLEDTAGEPVAVFFNFGSHPVTLHSYRGLISPDFPGYARQVIQQVLGKHVLAQFALGPAGDINPAGYIPNTFTPQRSWKYGAVLGCEAARLALGAIDLASPLLRVRSVMVPLPVEPLPTSEQLQQMHRQFSQQAARLRADEATWEAIARVEIQRDWAADALQTRERGEPVQHLDCEVMAVRFGDAVLLAAPLELFTATGLAIKAASPARATLICSNANGALGYLPTLDAYLEDDYTNPQGVAHKVYGLYAFSSDAEPLFREQAIRLLRDIFA